MIDPEDARRAIRVAASDALDRLDLRDAVYRAVYDAVSDALGLPGELRGRVAQAAQNAVERTLR